VRYNSNISAYYGYTEYLIRITKMWICWESEFVFNYAADVD